MTLTDLVSIEDPRIFGCTTMDIDATALMFELFFEHP